MLLFSKNVLTIIQLNFKDSEIKTPGCWGYGTPAQTDAQIKRL